jgi:hypothetical protein
MIVVLTTAIAGLALGGWRRPQRDHDSPGQDRHGQDARCQARPESLRDRSVDEARERAHTKPSDRPKGHDPPTHVIRRFDEEAGRQGRL